MLLEYGIVAVPGMGTFTLNSIESAFDSERRFMSPPVTILEFSSVVNENYLFAGQLFQSGMSNEDALHLQSLITSDHEAAIKDQTPFELEGLGTVINQVFHQKNESTFNRYFGLEAIEVTALPPFSKRIHPYAEIPTFNSLNNIKSLSTNRSAFSIYFWPILLAVLIALLIIYWFLSTSRIAPQENEDLVVAEQNQLDTSAFIKPTFNEDSLMNNIDSILASNTPNDNQPVSSLNPKNSNQKEIKKSCVVIIGAFKRKKNAEILMKKISSKGFETYTEISNGLRRVGITYDCSNKDPEEFKSSIKKQFNRDAWHLHDTL